MRKAEKDMSLPLQERPLLTLDEAVAYTGIGRHTLRKISCYEDCNFILWIGNKRMFKREKLMKFLDEEFSI